MQIYNDFFISATISSPNMTRDSNELKLKLYLKSSNGKGLKKIWGL